MHKKKWVYVSGKISGTDDFMERFDKAQKDLEDQGYSVLNPAKANSYMPEDATWNEYMHVSFALLEMADAIYMMAGWKDSRGSAAEHNKAKDIGLQIIYEKEGENENV